MADVQFIARHIIVCGDMNARTAEKDDYIQFADLQEHC